MKKTIREVSSISIVIFNCSSTMPRCLSCGNLSRCPIQLFCGHTLCGTCSFLVTYCNICYPTLTKKSDRNHTKDQGLSSSSQVDTKILFDEETLESAKRQICTLCDRCEINEKSKFLLCGHAFCGPCLVWYYEKRRSQKFLLCPTCGFEFIPPSKWWQNFDDERSEHEDGGDAAVPPISSPKNAGQKDFGHGTQFDIYRNENDQRLQKNRQLQFDQLSFDSD
uniref:RING-type domain-containing protein n=1 Tax=Romanomermis culicivorax TaxID=13658 RepID=A0A915J1J2_ROMCU